MSSYCTTDRGGRMTSARATSLALSAQAGDRKSFDSLASGCQCLLRAWAHNYAGALRSRPDPEWEDELVAAANLGLVENVRTFDPTRNPRFLALLKATAVNKWRGAYRFRKSGWSEGGEGSMRMKQALDIQVAADRASRAVLDEIHEEAEEEVRRILDKIGKRDAGLLEIVYGIGVDATGRPRQPRTVREIERAHGFQRNVLHRRLTKAIRRIREASEATI